MDTDALALARRLAADKKPERLSWGAVTLSVTDLPRAARFWTEAMGFVHRASDGMGLALGTTDRTLVVLQAGASDAAARRHAGLYHVAFGMPSQAEFSRRLLHLHRLGIPYSPVDHLMSKAIYIDDPDGHGIEIAYETPERFGRFSNAGGRFAIIDAHGEVRSGRERLDVREELLLAGGADPREPVHRDTTVAHLHLHVPELTTAVAWFEGIGFARNLNLGDLGMADMGTGGPYTHRLALNLWAGAGAKPAPRSSARLLAYALATPDPGVFATARTRLAADPATGELAGIDPAGISVRLRLERAAVSEGVAA